MLDRLRHSGPVRRLSAVGSRFVDTFIRENRVIPPVLALLALLVFAWIVAGLFVGGPSEEHASNRADIAQTEEQPAPRESPAPEIENRDADSYAAYQNKDPFRELLAPAEAAEDTTAEDTSGEDTSGEDTTAGPGRGGGDGSGGGGAGGGGSGGDGAGGGAGGKDTDGDGLSNERENALGLDPRNPDSDGDGTPDGDEETGGGRGKGGSGDRGGKGGGSGGGRGGLPESGGSF